MAGTRHRPGRADRLAMLALRAAALACLAVLAFSAWTHRSSLVHGAEAGRFALRYGAPLLAAALVLWTAAASRRVRPGWLMGAALVAVLMAYGTEVALTYRRYDEHGKVARAAATAGIAHDPRPLAEVVGALQASDPDVRPFMLARRGLPDRAYLGTFPLRTVVHCNQTGQYAVFRTDRHGFDNPDAVWTAGAPAVALVGSAEVQGACMAEGRSFAALLRVRGTNLLNLGMDGNGPVENLASVVEYAVPAGARTIVWVHQEGDDVTSLFRRTTHPVLLRYVDEPGFSQGLIGRADAVAADLDRLWRGQPPVPASSPWAAFGKSGVRADVMKLYRVRRALGMTQAVIDDTDMGLFAATMRRAKAVADQAGARLVVVSVPSMLDMEGAPGIKATQAARILAELGITVHDLRPLFAARPSVTALYAFGADGGHLSAEGHRVVAEALAPVLAEP